MEASQLDFHKPQSNQTVTVQNQNANVFQKKKCFGGRKILKRSKPPPHTHTQKQPRTKKLHVVRAGLNNGVFRSVDFLPPGRFTRSREVLHTLNPG